MKQSNDRSRERKTHHTTLHANWKRNETIQNMTNNNSPCSFLCMFVHLWWYAIEWLTRSSRKVVAMAIKRLLMILLPFIQPDDCFRSILHEICRKLVVFSHCCFCSFLVHDFFFFWLCVKIEEICTKNIPASCYKYSSTKRIQRIDVEWIMKKKDRCKAAIYSNIRISTDFRFW